MTLLGQEIDQTNISRKLLASFLVVLSGSIIFADKITTFGITENNGYRNVETFVWLITQSLSPIILCLAAMLKPFKIFYSIPLYIYFIQLYWVFDYDTKVDDPLLHFYAVSFSLGVFFFISITIYLIKQIASSNRILLLNIRKLTRHIGVTVRNKYIKEEDKKDYTIDTVKVIDSLDLD
ncbi:hypothetical protein [Aquimarina algiphila]|uniref:Uncharacterized protein n=1 Tax=Aquimarina algiphila TaxID=2047982 RepID=A0A554VFB1_9FLAO|nr:hypothetical protein [Aquimarina algiphila]TSE05827.1 hypothetical protein FOF46_21560 [Aquimarina algiphila]